MWIVVIDLDHYPSVREFETYEEAKAEFEDAKKYVHRKVYIAEVKEVAE